jgi:hypothetical protein
MPNYADAPQFRVEDFARMGYWIASALGIERGFSSALESVGHGTKGLNLTEDQILVDAIRIYIAKGKGQDWHTPSQLWSDLQIYAPDPVGLKKLYRGAVYLGKKLLVLQDSLKEVFEVEGRFDRDQSQRFWRFSAKDTVATPDGIP